MPDPIHDTAPGLPRLLEIMRRLRDPDTGCPWDIVQDFDSIAPYTIEESYEVADAIARRDWAHLESELGDLLLQAVYHAEIGKERGLFDFHSVAVAISDKMIARHPHVFAQGSGASSPEAQTRDWETLKAAERRSRAQGGVLADVALNLPALTRAEKLQKRAARVGFDWPDIGPVLDKIAEETAELAEARASGDQDHIAEEYGDLMFVMANLGRHLGLDPETALRAANAKFTRRFEAIEAQLSRENRRPEQASLAEMDTIWDAVKIAEKAAKAAASEGAA
ncbi:nucleoside triphosphate pyrophosphohydrolase [Pseudoruegeria sp. SK021]|uniref:nucleoside triphosphate pyrophosphohydrolase n=1 Tax=Pseudoruegeria sp. SK021 TaxID=1933035 RepID=UPI000A231225|nr:nucleoside triphosphate pyrophosphohydrolase [Pseudoruegeria sp. SK021]OSP55429.1 nucleoside triphosphate pyrophosphohydrolase [Pseudoruegeria sp. SK021]